MIPEEKLRSLLMQKSKEELVEELVNKSNSIMETAIRNPDTKEINKKIKKAVTDKFMQKLNNDTLFENLLFEKSTRCGETVLTPTTYFRHHLDKIDISDSLKLFSEKIEVYLNEHFDEILRAILLHTIVNGLQDNYAIQDAISKSVQKNLENNCNY